jgi:hypothetical protein
MGLTCFSMEGEFLVCGYCGTEFLRPHSSGPKPRFCSPGHRRAARRSEDSSSSKDSTRSGEGVPDLNLRKVRANLLASIELTSAAGQFSKGINAAKLLQAANPAVNLLRASAGFDRLAVAASGIASMQLKGFEPIRAINPLVGSFRTSFDGLGWTPAVTMTMPAGVDVSQLLGASTLGAGAAGAAFKSRVEAVAAKAIVPAGIDVSRLQWVVSPAIRELSEKFAATASVDHRLMSAIGQLVDMRGLIGTVVTNTDFDGWNELDHDFDLDEMISSEVSDQTVDEVVRQLSQPSDDLASQFGDLVGKSPKWTRADVVAGITALAISVFIYYVLLPLAMVLLIATVKDAVVTGAMIFQMIASLTEHSLLGTDLSFLGSISLVGGVATWMIKKSKDE